VEWLAILSVMKAGLLLCRWDGGKIIVLSEFFHIYLLFLFL
jgi:hypothetical protein